MASTAFHVAPTAARPAITQNGLFPSAPRPRWEQYELCEQPAGVYVWDTFQRALAWAQDFARLVRCPQLGECDVWRIDVEDLDLRVDPVLGDQGARYFGDHVPAHRLNLLTAIGPT